ncbi:type II toxin-antitoxin system prevent-host-death family antitoxin [Streptomyces sp. 21So2-11]|uniref:type II toxin-antitoxin system Phd/YefM family antitoxin n=1 Tax=Streptomyces sp. 21So2-11 TaxID=3144408 RepID=UPI00321A8806
MELAKRKRVPARDLARHTAALLDAVAAGESIEVTRDGVPVAILAPLDPAERDIRAAIAVGVLDSAVLEESHADEITDALGQLRAVRKKSAGRGLTAELLAQRDEETV